MVVRHLKKCSYYEAEHVLDGIIDRMKYVYDVTNIFKREIPADIVFLGDLHNELLCFNRVNSVYRVKLLTNLQNGFYTYFIIQKLAPFEYLIQKVCLDSLCYIAVKCV